MERKIRSRIEPLYLRINALVLCFLSVFLSFVPTIFMWEFSKLNFLYYGIMITCFIYGIFILVKSFDHLIMIGDKVIIKRILKKELSFSLENVVKINIEKKADVDGRVVVTFKVISMQFYNDDGNNLTRLSIIASKKNIKLFVERIKKYKPNMYIDFKKQIPYSSPLN